VRITVELPDDVARHTNPGRDALDALAIEGYRSGALSHYQAGRLMGLAQLEFDIFLKARGVNDHAYDLKDLDRDLADLGALELRNLTR
jgi:predicted HTH domain antitoxin